MHTFVYASGHAFWQGAANQNPQKAYAHLEAGNQCRLIEDIVCAEEHFRQALVIDPEYGHALSNLGVLMVEREKYQEAQVLLEKAIRVDPTRATVYGNRIFLAEKTGSGREKIPGWKKKADLFKKMKRSQDYLLGELRFR